MEVLTPAGKIESLIMAVTHGADAVYLGLSEFNARLKSGNFSLGNLKEWVEYAHFFGVKVYLTVNILIKNSELKRAAEMVRQACILGVDAIIVQDIGLLGVLHSSMPNIVLHLSTQAGINNTYGAKLALALGAKRVILARETPITEIAEISKIIETEVFVHGALCVAYSGNCYYSSLVSGNSGNRGLCMQLCRKEYKHNISEEKSIQGKYLLSPKDLCLIKQLARLKNAGVAAIKIEGRLKRAEYAGETARRYKSALKNLEKPDIFVAPDDIQSLKTIFNRGSFSEGYLEKSNGYSGLIFPDTQGHIGIPAGTVESVNIKNGTCDFAAANDSGLIFSDGDGFKVLRDGVETGSAGGEIVYLGGKIYRTSFRGDVIRGDVLNITTYTKQIAELNENKRARKVRFFLTALSGKPAIIYALDSDTGLSFRYESDYIVPDAINKETTESELKESLNKTGGSDFFVETIEVDKSETVFIPRSIQNALRREALNGLKQAIIDFYTPKYNLPDKLEIDTTKERNILSAGGLGIIVDSFEKLNALKNYKTAFLVYNPSDYDRLEQAAAGNIYLNIPVIADTEALKRLFEKFTGLGYAGVVANNLGTLDAAAEMNIPYILGNGLNVFNNQYQKTIESACKTDLLCCAVIFSSENYRDANKEHFIYAYGKFALMTTAHCPYKTVFNDSCKSCRNGKTALKYTDDHGKVLEIRKVSINGKCKFEFRDSTPLELPAGLRGKTNLLLDFTDISLQQMKDALALIKTEKSINEKPNYFSATN